MLSLHVWDTRLVNFLEDSMDIGRGEAKIVKTAGTVLQVLLMVSCVAYLYVFLS